MSPHVVTLVTVPPGSLVITELTDSRDKDRQETQFVQSEEAPQLTSVTVI